jgi:uncharacterized protein
MTELFVRLHLFLARHRGAVLVLAALFAAGALLCSRRLKINEDFTDMLPMSDPAIAGQVEALKHVRQADRVFIDVQTTSPDQELLFQAADRMGAALRTIPGLTDLRYTVEATDMHEIYARLQSQLPTLLSSNELHELEPKLSAGALEDRLAWLKRAMTQPQGLMLKEVARSDPVGLGDLVAGRLRALQAGLGDASIVAGRITSADGRHVLISATPGFRPTELSRSATLVALVLKAARAVEAEFPAGSVRIAVTGAHRVALDNATIIRKDTTLTTVIATVAVAGLMFAAYRRRWLALLGLVPTVFGALGAMVLFYLLGRPVSAVALGCGSILIGVTVDYGIYVLYHTDDLPPENREQLARAVAQLVPALTFGALTTMAAFLAMFASPVSGHRQLGLFGAVGVALAALFAMVVLPLFIPATRNADVSAATAGHTLPLTHLMQRLFVWRDRRAAVVLPLLLIFSALCMWGVWRLRFEGDFSRLNGISPDTRRDEAAVREVWSKALSLTTVVVTGATREEALRQNERVCAALRELQQNQQVESFSSIAGLCPAEQTRQINHRAWQAFWTEARRHDVSNALASAAAKLGFETRAFAEFSHRLAAPPDLTATGPAGDGPLGRLLGDYWSEQGGHAAVCTLVKARDREGFLRLRDAVRRAVPGALLLNKAALSDEIVRIVRRALPVFAVLVVALNALLLFLLLGRVELVLITLLPMATGMFWTLGTLGLLGLPIDMANSIFAVFVIGVGGDYSLFMVMAELEVLRGSRDRTASTGGAVTICAGTTLLGVGVLVLAQHPAMFSIGLSALLGISFTLLATLFLVPPCMARLARRAAKSAASVGEARAADLAVRRRQLRSLYRCQGAYVEQYVFWKLRTDPLFGALDRAAPRQGHIFDAGCGYGLVMHWLELDSPQRTLQGLDHDPAKVRVARSSARHSSRLSFQQGDLLTAAWPRCDAVLLCDVLHYFPRESKARVLQRAFEALRVGGSLIVRDACSNGSAHRAVAWSERFAVWTGHNKTACGLHFEDTACYVSLLSAAGFVQVHPAPEAGLGSNIMLVATKPGPAITARIMA